MREAAVSGHAFRQNHTRQTGTRASYIYSKTEIVTRQYANGKVIGFLPQTSLVISIKTDLRETHAQ